MKNKVGNGRPEICVPKRDKNNKLSQYERQKKNRASSAEN